MAYHCDPCSWYPAKSYIISLTALYGHEQKRQEPIHGPYQTLALRASCTACGLLRFGQQSRSCGQLPRYMLARLRQTIGTRPAHRRVPLR